MAELEPQAGSIEAHALARHVRMSPQKARLVMDLIRGQKAQAALQTLRFTPKRAAKHIEKVLRSAIASVFRLAFGVGDSAAQNLFDVLGRALGREAQRLQRCLRLLPADQVHHQARLLRRHAHVPRQRVRFDRACLWL